MNIKLTKKLSLLMLISAVGMNAAIAKGNFQYQAAAPTQYQGSYYPSNNQNYGQNYGQQNYGPSSGTKNQTLKGRVVTVPAGIGFPAVVSMPLSSEFLVTGQPVSVTLGSDFYYNSTLIAPAGSNVLGTVLQASKAKHGSMNGTLCIRFTEITTPYGTRIPIAASIKTDDGTGILKGGTKADVTKAYAKDMAVGAGAGALTGLVASAISGGAIGKGTAIMTGVGMAGGLAKSVYDKGADVVIPSGASIQLEIDQPITVNPSGYSYDY